MIIISEYVEGSSLNKALEFFNPTGNPIDLSAGNYSVEFYFDGNTTPNTTINLTGAIAARSTYVLAKDNANATILGTATQTNASSFFNGNDAILLKSNGTIIDSLGQVGFNPGSQWGSGVTSTQDNTLRRKSSVFSGDADPLNTFDPSIEWDGFAQNTVDDLGAHTIQTRLAIAPTTAIQSEGDTGTKNFTFTVTRLGGISTAETVDFAITGGVDGADFGGTLPGGIIGFAANDTSTIIPLSVSGDADPEADENFTVTLSGASGGATITTATAMGVIINDDTASSNGGSVGGPTPVPTPVPLPGTSVVELVDGDASGSFSQPIALAAISTGTDQTTFTLRNTSSVSFSPRFTALFAPGTLPAGLTPADIFIFDPPTTTLKPSDFVNVNVRLRNDLLPGTYGAFIAIAGGNPNIPEALIPVSASVRVPTAAETAASIGTTLPSDSPIWTAGDDTITGVEIDGDGDQWLNGSSGDDLIFGNQGRDVLTGGPGSDTLLGGQGDDFLRGANGDDVLFGDRGDDILTGNNGADSFVLVAGFGSDLILDFEDGIDKIRLASPLTLADLTFMDQGNSTEIRTGNGLLAMVIGLDSSLLTAADFAPL